jgi:NAD(P)-dependent dehydrogenase (short-subunit alcohol dehydrogenase family)
MASTQKTVILTGASQGIGAAVVRAFLERGYNVVGTSRNATKSAELKASDKLVLVDETSARRLLLKKWSTPLFRSLARLMSLSTTLASSR